MKFKLITYHIICFGLSPLTFSLKYRSQYSIAHWNRSFSFDAIIIIFFRLFHSFKRKRTFITKSTFYMQTGNSVFFQVSLVRWCCCCFCFLFNLNSVPKHTNTLKEKLLRKYFLRAWVNQTVSRCECVR